MKNYRAQTPQNLALTKILQKFRKNEHTPENGYRVHSFYLRFITIASIIFENPNVDVDTKGQLTRYDVRLRSLSHGMGCVDVNDTVHMVRL